MLVFGVLCSARGGKLRGVDLVHELIWFLVVFVLF